MPEFTGVPHSASVMTSTRHRHSRQTHLHQSLFDGRLTPSISLDDRCFKSQPRQLRDLQSHLPGLGLELALLARYELQQLEREATAAAAQLAEQRRLELEREAKRRRDLQLLKEDQARKQAGRKAEQAQRWREFNEGNKRKEAAWREFYKPAPECLSEVRVECGNAYMRARQEFERRYAAGEL